MRNYYVYADMPLLHCGVGQTEGNQNGHHNLGKFKGTGYGAVKDIAQGNIRGGEKHHHRQDADPYDIYHPA